MPVPARQPVVDRAGLCTVFEMGTGKVSMSNGDPTGDFGNLCMVGGSLSMSGGQLVKGDAYLGAKVQISISGTTAIRGEIFQPYDLTAEVNAAFDASSTKGALACDQNLADLKKAQTIYATKPGENVLCVNNVALNQVVTLNAGGYSGVSFVINVKGGFALTGGPGGQIRVQTPLQPKDVLINVLGTGTDVKFSGSGNASVVDGTILAPYRKIGIAPGGSTDRSCPPATSASRQGRSSSARRASSRCRIPHCAFAEALAACSRARASLSRHPRSGAPLGRFDVTIVLGPARIHLELPMPRSSSTRRDQSCARTEERRSQRGSARGPIQPLNHATRTAGADSAGPC